MRTHPGDSYTSVAKLWNALYDAPPPAERGAGDLLDALIGAMEPLAFDQFYDPYLRSASPPADERGTPLPSPARVRAMDLALRAMLRTCPVPDRLQSLVEQIDRRILAAPALQLDGVAG